MFSTTGIHRNTKSIRELGSHDADVSLSVPKLVEAAALGKLIHYNQLLAVTLDAMPRKAVEEGNLAVWVVPRTFLDGFAYTANLIEVRFVLNLEQVRLSLLVEVNKSVTPECIQEKSNVFKDRLKILDALLYWSTFFLQLLQVFDLFAQDLPC